MLGIVRATATAHTAASRHVKAAGAVVTVGGTAGSFHGTIQNRRISVHG